MNLSTAVQSIVSKYGYEVFDNLHLIKDEELSEAVKTVRLARRSDDEIDQELHELVKTCRSIDEISQKISLSKRTTLKHLNFHVWGRAFIEKVFPVFVFMKKSFFFLYIYCAISFFICIL